MKPKFAVEATKKHQGGMLYFTGEVVCNACGEKIQTHGQNQMGLNQLNDLAQYHLFFQCVVKGGK